LRYQNQNAVAAVVEKSLQQRSVGLRILNRNGSSREWSAAMAAPEWRNFGLNFLNAFFNFQLIIE
jgi:hypothetical protein